MGRESGTGPSGYGDTGNATKRDHGAAPRAGDAGFRGCDAYAAPEPLVRAAAHVEPVENGVVRCDPAPRT